MNQTDVSGRASFALVREFVCSSSFESDLGSGRRAFNASSERGSMEGIPQVLAETRGGMALDCLFQDSNLTEAEKDAILSLALLKLAQKVRGHVEVEFPDATVSQFFIHSLLPTLLSNPEVESINGLSRITLAAHISTVQGDTFERDVLGICTALKSRNQSVLGQNEVRLFAPSRADIERAVMELVAEDVRFAVEDELRALCPDSTSRQARLEQEGSLMHSATSRGAGGHTSLAHRIESKQFFHEVRALLVSKGFRAEFLEDRLIRSSIDRAVGQAVREMLGANRGGMPCRQICSRHR